MLLICPVRLIFDLRTNPPTLKDWQQNCLSGREAEKTPSIIYPILYNNIIYNNKILIHISSIENEYQ